MTPARFTQIGEALFGPSWRGKMAVALKVSERTIHRWLDSRPIPVGIEIELAGICRQHAADLITLAKELDHG
jgi:hypothetical protein